MPTLAEIFAAYFVLFVYDEGFFDDAADLGLTEEDLTELEYEIMDGGRNSPVIKGTNGLRKMRFAPASWNVGKSGATRVLLVYFEDHRMVYLFGIYAKNVQGAIPEAAKKIYREQIKKMELWLNEQRENEDRK